MCEEQGTSIILITHNMGVVAEICDYVYVMYAGKVMEQAETFALFERPGHPYTQGLLKSIPKLDEKADRLYTIEGVVPNLLHLPKGCSFCTRCGQANERCFAEKPYLYETGGDSGEAISGDSKNQRPGSQELTSHGIRCFQYEGGGKLDE